MKCVGQLPRTFTPPLVTPLPVSGVSNAAPPSEPAEMLQQMFIMQNELYTNFLGRIFGREQTLG